MTIDSIILAAVAAELNKTLSDGRVDKGYQPSPLDIVLVIRANGANHSLLISADAQSPRLHLTSSKRPNPQAPPNFCMVLRKYLEGARFVGISQPGFDRIARLKFSAYDGEQITLVVEIMGKHSNVILTSGTDRILGVIKPVGRQKNRYREILPGKDYIPPPSQNKSNPLEASAEDFSERLATAFPNVDCMPTADLASWLTKAFTGISPFAGRELALRSEGKLLILAAEFADFFGHVQSADFLPVYITDDSGMIISFYAFPSVQHAEANQHERSSINAVMDMYYTSALPRQAFQQAKDELTNFLHKEIESCELAIAAIHEGIEECKGAERFKQIGELILSQTASIRKDAESAELVDYYDPNGASVSVELDTRLSAAENAEAYFKKYHKAVSGAEALKERLAEMEVSLNKAKRALLAADSACSKEETDSLVKTLAAEGIRIHKQEASVTEKRKLEFEGHRISRVESNGWEILIGQNSQSNDYLLARVAKPNDIWLHVKAAASAHVVIRTNGKPDSVPRQVLNAAASLTAQNSDAKHSSLVPVDYTLRKYVRKPKGAASGRVIYQNERTIYITP